MNFGVIGTANIARAAVAPAVRASDHDLLAVASRDEARAASFADEFDVPRAYPSYEDLLADDDLDAVYNPLPNSLHARWTKRAADAGLHVLCEKPLAVDANEAIELARYCRDRDVTLMEAFMYRYHPRTARAAELAAELGPIRHVTATFTFPLSGSEDVRLQSDLAGGSLMDVGCYAVSAARLFLGEPDRAYAHALDTRDAGVDTTLAGVLEYPDAVARVAAGFDNGREERVRVSAEDGWFELSPAFLPSADERATLEYELDGRRGTETFDPVDQYRREVEAFVEAVETETAPLTDGLEAARTLAVVDALAESANADAAVSVDEPHL